MDAEDAQPRPPRRLALLAAVLGGLALVAIFWGRLHVGRTFGFGGASCGNGRVEGSEACDDGNQNAEDGCLPSCELASCGDGIKRAYVEECDDGNRDDGDGCSSGCVLCPVGPGAFSSASNGHCYWRDPRPLSFSEAAKVCSEQRGYLATYGSDLEWREVTERLLATGERHSDWIGLRQEDRNGVRDFGWVSGDRLLFSHWAIHEPRRAPGLDCAAQSETGTWTAVACDEQRAFVCERPRWTRHPTETRSYRRFADRRRWDDAVAICQRNGGRLVAFRNLADQERVSRRYPGPIWIGARIDEKTGEFAWVTAGEPLGYRDFAPGEPNLLSTQRCLALEIDGRWYNRECSDRYGFVCEVL